MPEFARTLGVMIGLGVGIDYALFIVTRYREDLHTGQVVEQATASPSTPPAGPCLRRHHGRHLAARHGRHGLGFITGLAIGAATVVRSRWWPR